MARQGGTYTKTAWDVLRFPRGVHNLHAVVMLGQHGKVSVDAMRWCQAQRVSLFILDSDGELVSVTTPHPPLAVTLRRAQYAAQPLPLAQSILMKKLGACAAVRPKIAPFLKGIMTEIAEAPWLTIGQLRMIEAQAAARYWPSWRLRLRHYAGFPEHWRVFEQRGSAISGGPRKATHPVNAILNYAYSVLAGQVQRAAVAKGLDVAVGTLHADSDGRDSLTYDLMEPLRPRVDSQVLGWVAATKWRRTDFKVTVEGIVRLHQDLAKVVVQKAVLPGREVEGVVNWYVGVLGRSSELGRCLKAWKGYRG